jgi:hypothetical protein
MFKLVRQLFGNRVCPLFWACMLKYSQNTKYPLGDTEQPTDISVWKNPT